MTGPMALGDRLLPEVTRAARGTRTAACVAAATMVLAVVLQVASAVAGGADPEALKRPAAILAGGRRI